MGLFSLSLTGMGLWTLVITGIFAGLALLAGNARRSAVDNGLTYTRGHLARISLPAAIFLLALFTISSPWAGVRSLVLGAAIIAVSGLVGESFARRLGERQGFLSGTGWLMASHLGGVTVGIIGFVWLIAVLLGLTVLASVAVGLITPIVATKRGMTAWALQNKNFAQCVAVVAGALQVPESAINPGDFTGDLMTGIDIVNVPIAAAKRRDQIEAQLTLIYPGLTVGTCDHDRITLVPVTAEVADARRIEQESGGLVSGIADTPQDTFTWGAPAAAAAPVADTDAGSDW